MNLRVTVPNSQILGPTHLYTLSQDVRMRQGRSGGAQGWGGGGRVSDTLPPLLKSPPPQCRDGSPPQALGGRSRSDGSTSRLHHTMIALKLQQFQYNLKKNFLRHALFPMLVRPSDAPPPGGGGDCRGGGGDFKGGGG